MGQAVGCEPWALTLPCASVSSSEKGTCFLWSLGKN